MSIVDSITNGKIKKEVLSNFSSDLSDNFQQYLYTLQFRETKGIETQVEYCSC